MSFDKNEMNTLKTSIDNLVTDHNGCDEQSHIITVANIYENLVFMKSGKNDGQFGHYSDHIINGTLKLNVYISLLFTSMISHGSAPEGLRLSTLIPIPKNKRKSLNDSDNYRAIALSSVLGKLLDRIF